MMDRKLPLFIVTGASGVGKTTVMKELRKQLPEFVIFSTDSDLFGHSPEVSDYQLRFNLLLRFAHYAALSGRGTIICGTMMPWDVKKCDKYHEFSKVCFINLHCDDVIRNARLRNREDKATWTDEMLRSHEEFAHWLLSNADTAYDPPMPSIDTTSTPPNGVAEQIARYVLLHWQEQYTSYD
jgi:hypothetical protein